MKRTLFISAVLLALFTVSAFAADGVTYQAKYGAVDPTAVYEQILALEFPDGDARISKAPDSLLRDTAAYIVYQETSIPVNIQVVMPEFKAQEIPEIQSSSVHNQSIAALIDYVYQYRTLTQISEAYEAALGTAPTFHLNKYTFGREYEQAGKTYTLSQVYMGQTITQSLVVSSIQQSKPSVTITDDAHLSCTPELVQYSLDENSWVSLKDGDSIPAKCFGENVYFRTPANSYSEASESVRVRVKDKQDPPTAKLELTTTSFSISINNANDYGDCEFSIDGKKYSSKTTWYDLDPDTKYTVYVRYEETSKYFASTPLSLSVTTGEGNQNKITYTTKSNAHTTYFVATGIAQGTVNGATLSATYTDATISKLKNDVKAADKKMSAVTVLGVSLLQENGDTRDVKKVKFSMPKDLGLLQLRLKTPFATVIVSDNSTTVEIEAIGTSTTTGGLKDFVSGKDLVYKVTSAGNGKIQILYPWEFPDRADLSGLQVRYMDTKYANETGLTYQVVEDGILFVLPSDGYFSIRNLHRDYGSLPFSDCQTHWAYSYIYYAYENGLVNGVSATEFSPDTNVTRAQIAVLLARMAGADVNKTYTHPYTDIPRGSWYEWAVGYLYQQGALKDQGTGLFEASESITREQMAALTAQVFPYKGTIWSPIPCTDRDQISTYAMTAVDGLYNRSVLEGDEKGNFNPKSSLTRGEFVAILYRLENARGLI